MGLAKKQAILIGSAVVGLFAHGVVVRAEVMQEHGVRVIVQGQMVPKKLPRRTPAPVSISLGARVRSTSAAQGPQLQRIEIALNRHGKLRSGSLPHCRYGQISPSTTAEALAACRSSLVGEGQFSADVRLPEQSPFPSVGRVLAFNGRFKGQPALFAHIYGTEPIPTSFVLPFVISRTRGTYGTLLQASLPQVTGNWGFVRRITMDLSRKVGPRGETVGYLTASCPAPSGFSGAVFPLAKTTFSFSGGTDLSTVLIRHCEASGR